MSSPPLLTKRDVRALAEQHGIRPTKKRGQNFVVDPNTIRRLVRLANVTPDDVVLEVGPGLGSLTLGLLDAGCRVIAVEIDRGLAQVLPQTVAAQRDPATVSRLQVVTADAMQLTGPVVAQLAPTALVANLPYNVAVPVLLQVLQNFPSVGTGLVMVQSEVADRLVAAPGEAAYGVPSAKVAWYAQARRAGSVAPGVFWPVPRVDSGLVAFARHPPPLPAELARALDVNAVEALRRVTFSAIDAAFSQRRKMLRTSLAGWFGGVRLDGGRDAKIDDLMGTAGIDPASRAGEVGIEGYVHLASQLS